MYHSDEEVTHNGKYDDDDVVVNVPAIKYAATSGSSTARGGNRVQSSSSNYNATDPHHSDESNTDSYDNVPLILGSSQQREY